MRIEKETEVTIKVKIGYVYPDDFMTSGNESVPDEEWFRNEFLPLQDPVVRDEIIVSLWERTSRLLQDAEVSVRDLGVVQE